MRRGNRGVEKCRRNWGRGHAALAEATEITDLAARMRAGVCRLRWPRGRRQGTPPSGLGGAPTHLGDHRFAGPRRRGRGLPHGAALQCQPFVLSGRSNWSGARGGIHEYRREFGFNVGNGQEGYNPRDVVRSQRLLSDLVDRRWPCVGRPDGVTLVEFSGHRARLVGAARSAILDPATLGDVSRDSSLQADR